MSLLSSISSSCRVVSQGNTYTWETEPYITANFIAVDSPTDATKKIYEKQVVKQWRGVVHFAKTYEYVGLTEAAARAGATTVMNAYTMSVAKWGLGIETDTTSHTAQFLMVSIGSGTACFAEATPMHVAGQMWSLAVRVNASIETYTGKDASAPSAGTLRGLVSSIANFPEG